MPGVMPVLVKEGDAGGPDAMIGVSGTYIVIVFYGVNIKLKLKVL